MTLATAIGYSNFSEIRQQGLYYVDKSHLISELLAAHGKVLLLPRPRRFGKTLNLTMLEAFFDHQQDASPLFQDLAISRDAAAMQHLNQYPTLYLTLKDTAFATWSECEVDIKARVSELVGNHKETLFRIADATQRSLLQALYDQKASMVHVAKSLRFLLQLLHQASGKKVIVLIDEYDNPIHEGKNHGYFDEVISIFFKDAIASWLGPPAQVDSLLHHLLAERSGKIQLLQEMKGDPVLPLAT